MKFGKLTVLSPLDTKSGRAKRVKCLCECGKTSIAQVGNLRSGHTKSCGCLQIEANTLHGKATTPEFWAWVNMIERCTKPHHPSYRLYGERGISVHGPWRAEFAAFYRDVGPRPTPKHSLDRINNDLGYVPGNVRWATKSEQARNRRVNHWIEIDGRRQLITDWATEAGIHFTTIAHRIARGMSKRDAILTPPRFGGRRASKQKETVSA